jgi:hypothetical protein
MIDLLVAVELTATDATATGQGNLEATRDFTVQQPWTFASGPASGGPTASIGAAFRARSAASSQAGSTAARSTRYGTTTNETGIDTNDQCRQ